ncbi:MAG: Gfo/Idh/MocA family oxidoreductase [Thermoanaerobaculales bacterium]|nr:Gfo/Idh/MocA family oxidoreductase [Thermoanaerobaculales bacterium]
MSTPTTNNQLTAAVVGTGHLGRHHVRILNQRPDIRFLGAFDTDREQLESITTEHGVKALTSIEAAREADLVVVATPTVSHREIGGDLLAAGCHVMVEKPITATVAEAQELIALAAANNRVLAVGHVEFHNPAVQAALDACGGVRYMETQRLSPFTARSVDVDVILDLMIHDLQITLAVAGEEPSDIRAVGVNVLTDKVDLCHAWVEFPSGLVANLTASRVSAERIRKLRLFANEGYFSIDYAEQSVQSARLVRTESGADIQPRIVDVEKAEPLAAELEAFVKACRGEETPLVDGHTGASALAAAIRVRESVEART